MLFIAFLSVKDLFLKKKAIFFIKKCDGLNFIINFAAKLCDIH